MTTMFLSKISARLLIATVLALGFMMFVPEPASAFYSSLPANNGNQYLEVSRIGNGNGLDAPAAYINIYFNSAAGGTVLLWDADHCAAGPDTNTPAPTSYLLYPATATEQFPGIFTPHTRVDAAVNQPMSNIFGTSMCGLRTIARSGLTPSVKHPGYFVAVLLIAHTGSVGDGGINAFKLSANNADNSGALLGYYSEDWVTQNPGDPGMVYSFFALQDRVSATNTFSNFNFDFAPPCNYGVRTGYFKWRDDDWGGLQTSPNFRTVVREYDRVSGVLLATNIVYPRSGNLAFGQAAYTFRSDRRYSWTWENVIKTNGIQIYMPFSSMGASLTCPPPTPPTISCSAISISVETGQQFNLTPTFTTAGGASGQPNTLYSIQVNLPAAGVNNEYFAAFASIPWAGGTGSGTRSNLVINTPGLHTGTYVVRVNEASNTPQTCTISVTVHDRPYFKVYGGDVHAGSGFGEACATDAQARIIGWHNGAGSGTQLAAFALNTITGFASGQARAATDYDHLTFANTSGTYGGNFAATNTICAADYWGEATGVLTGNQTISGRNLGMGTRQTIYVDGNAYISGSIRYAGGSYNDISQIPAFRLIVKGNIYVAPSVTELNGLFVAMPDGGDTGRFYTCSNGFGRPTQTLLDSACQNPLTVYGSVVADLIKFNRSGGSLRHAGTGETWNSGGVPAEKFIYTPESWLTSEFTQGGEAQSYRTLPPVL